MEEVLRRTSLAPLASPCSCTSFSSRRLPGKGGDHFHCTVEPSPGHIRRRFPAAPRFLKYKDKRKLKPPSSRQGSCNTSAPTLRKRQTAKKKQGLGVAPLESPKIGRSKRGRLQISTSERKRAQTSANASLQKSAKAKERFRVKTANNQAWELPSTSIERNCPEKF